MYNVIYIYLKYARRYLYVGRYTVSLFGHSRLSNSINIEQALERTVRELIKSKEYVEFLVGRKGDFDILAASVIRTVDHTLGHGNV